MGDLFRIFFYHVPNAILALGAPVHQPRRLALLPLLAQHATRPALAADAFAIASAEVTVVLTSIGLAHRHACGRDPSGASGGRGTSASPPISSSGCSTSATFCSAASRPADKPTRSPPSLHLRRHRRPHLLHVHPLVAHPAPRPRPHQRPGRHSHAPRRLLEPRRLGHVDRLRLLPPLCSRTPPPGSRSHSSRTRFPHRGPRPPWILKALRSAAPHGLRTHRLLRRLGSALRLRAVDCRPMAAHRRQESALNKKATGRADLSPSRCSEESCWRLGCCSGRRVSWVDTESFQSCEKIFLTEALRLRPPKAPHTLRKMPLLTRTSPTKLVSPVIAPRRSFRRYGARSGRLRPSSFPQLRRQLSRIRLRHRRSLQHGRRARPRLPSPGPRPAGRPSASGSPSTPFATKSTPSTPAATPSPSSTRHRTR